MVLTNNFEVDAPLDLVWAQMLDVPRLVKCMPGVELTGVIDERTFEGKIGFKVGPIALAYRTRLHLEEVNQEARTVTLWVEANDSRGRGAGSAVVTATMREGNGKTAISMESDVALTGLVARFGRSGIIEDVSQRMAQRFANCLEQELRQPS